MKERPILFSAPMVRALLAGTKTQTRRVMSEKHCWHFIEATGDLALCPYGRPGDRLWVRETWVPDPPIDDSWASTAWNGCGRTVSEIPERFHHPRFCNYAADWLHGPIRWTPSIHMPRWASRITLEVTDVRVERLQSISESDAIAEGIEIKFDGQGNPLTFGGTIDALRPHAAREAYRALWESINGLGSWDANPWVWVVEFRRV